jgi:hypothetical protein
MWEVEHIDDSFNESDTNDEVCTWLKFLKVILIFKILTIYNFFILLL